MLTVNIEEAALGRGSNLVALIRHCRLDVARGEVVSVVGPSGCGKTTLLRIIAGLEHRFQGSVLLGGQPYRRPSLQVQLVFQDCRLLPWMTVEQNLRFPSAKSSGDLDAAVSRALEICRLNGVRGALPRTLSGGEMSRVALARALVRPARVLLLDEPFRSLDVEVRDHLRSEVLSILRANQCAVLHVSHSVDEAVLWSDRVVVVGTRPMSVVTDIAVPFSWPRGRHDAGVVDVVRSVERAAKSC